MKFEINVEKKYVFIIVVSVLVLAGGLFAYAYGSGGPPNVVGHSFEELEGAQAKITNGLTACAGSNKAIKTINPNTGAVTCEIDDIGGGGGGGAGTLDCTTVQYTLTISQYNANVNCGSGYKATGGGGTCWEPGSGVLESSKEVSGGEIWEIRCTEPGLHTVYAVCCRVV